jgi:hypothetical protein
MVIKIKHQEDKMEYSFSVNDANTSTRSPTDLHQMG